MPLYDFFNETTQETREVFFKMDDVKEYNGEDGTEIGQWRRLYSSPQLSIDTDFDPRNKEEFIRRGEKYKDLGSLMDKSRELSEKREQKDGRDSVKDKFFEDYKKTRNGKEHPLSKPKKIETKFATVDFTAKG